MCIYCIDLQIYISDSYVYTSIDLQIYILYRSIDLHIYIYTHRYRYRYTLLLKHKSPWRRQGQSNPWRFHRRRSSESCRKASGLEMIQKKEANIDKPGGFMIIKLEISVQIYESYEAGCFLCSQHLRRAHGRMISWSIGGQPAMSIGHDEAGLQIM